MAFKNTCMLKVDSQSSVVVVVYNSLGMLLSE